jgi:hypothetical protein
MGVVELAWLVGRLENTVENVNEVAQRKGLSLYTSSCPSAYVSLSAAYATRFMGLQVTALSS